MQSKTPRTSFFLLYTAILFCQIMYSEASAALPITASGVIFIDTNDNGTLNTGESPMSSALTTRLFQGTTETDSQNGSGNYSFSIDTAGDYEIQGIVPDGYKNAGDTFTIDIGTVDNTTPDIIINIGFVPVVNIGDVVYEEKDGIAGFSAGDDGISGITVQLLDDTGSAITGVNDIITGTDGQYKFSDLAGGDYTVKIDQTSIPSQYELNTPSNGEHSTGNLTVGSDYFDYDFALTLIGTATINGQIWSDINIDSHIDSNEIFNTTNYTTDTESTLTVRETGTTVDIETITTTDGTFIFENLDPSKIYEVELVSIPNLYNKKNADIISTGTAIGNGVFGTSFDFEIEEKPTGSLGGNVFVDLDNNGLIGTEEIGLEGITLELFEDDGTTVFDEATTDTDGAYVFENLQDGEIYIVKIEDENFESGGTLFSFANTTGQTDNQETTEAYDAASPQGDLDFGYIASSISGKIWHDLNRDGIYDIGEAILPDVDMSLLNDNGDTILQTTTDSEGSYTFIFSDLGDLDIILDQSNFFVSGALYGKGQTTAYTKDGNPLYEVSITNNGTILTEQDWGYASSIISGSIWEDENFNKIKEETEALIGGVQVDLIDANQVIVVSEDSEIDGTFEFEDIPAGSYSVSISSTNFDTGEVLEGYTITNLDAGIESFVLAGGAIKDDIVFGYEKSAIQGYVFRDSNGDGDMTGDAGVGGVVLELLDENGGAVLGSDQTTPVTITTVDDGTTNGFYAFEELEDGSYKILVSDSNFETGGSLETLNPTNDISETVFVISGGTIFFDQNIGYETSGIGDLVFWDEDGNGVFDAGTDSGIAGVKIKLTDSDGSESFVLTDSDGSYNFNTPGGTYVIGIDNSNFEEDGVLEDLFALNITTTGGSERTVNTVFGQNYGEADFGIGKSNLGGTIWLDADKDGVIDEEENLFENVIVVVTFDDETEILALTDSEGFYEFENLPTGSFVISLDETQSVISSYDVNGNNIAVEIEHLGTTSADNNFAITTKVVTTSSGNARICTECKNQIKIGIENQKRAPLFCNTAGYRDRPECQKYKSKLTNPAPAIYHAPVPSIVRPAAPKINLKNNFITQERINEETSTRQMRSASPKMENQTKYDRATQTLLDRSLITKNQAEGNLDQISYTEGVKLLIHYKGYKSTYEESFSDYERILKQQGFQTEETNPVLYREFGYMSQEKAIFFVARAHGHLSAEDITMDPFWFDRYKNSLKSEGILTSKLEKTPNPFYRLSRKEFYEMLLKS